MAAKVSRNIKIVGAVPAKKSSSAVNGAFRRTDTKIASFKKASTTISAPASRNK